MVFLIYLYRSFVSPLTWCSCRFTPTCSQYAIDALKKYGPLKGIILIFSRLIRCHPYTKLSQYLGKTQGYDPIPQTFLQTKNTYKTHE
ncbi:MAG: membrane protein insertion efficiency factor YidD [Alphaproteobacteria bacterium]